MAPNLVGKNPVETEALWRQNKQQAWWYGYHGGIASYAVAAIDIALWDLKGKALNASVLDLLGGCVHEKLPVIASCHAHYESIPDMADETARWMEDGYQGLKTGFGKRGNANLGYDHDRDVASRYAAGREPGHSQSGRPIAHPDRDRPVSGRHSTARILGNQSRNNPDSIARVALQNRLANLAKAIPRGGGGDFF